MGSPSDWYLVNQWPLSMLIAVEGSGGSSSACVAVPGDLSAGVRATRSGTRRRPHRSPCRTACRCCSSRTSTSASPRTPVPTGSPRTPPSSTWRSTTTPAIAGIADPSIPEFPPGPGLPPEGDGPCGPGRYARFTVNGERFFSWIGIGSGASDEDRETVETSYEMMSAIPDWEPSPPNETTPAYVVAGGGSEAGEDWRVELRPDGRRDPAVAGGCARLRIVLLTGGSVEPLTWTGTDPIFGAITKQATGVEFRPGSGNVDYALGQSPVAGTIVPRPANAQLVRLRSLLHRSAGRLRRARRACGRAGCGDAERRAAAGRGATRG